MGLTQLDYRRDFLQSKLQEILLAMPVAVAWANLWDGRIQFVNQRFTDLFGYPLEELSTVQAWIDSCYAQPDQAQEVKRFWASLRRASDRLPGAMNEIELDVRCKDGTIKTVLSGKKLMPEEGWALSTFVDMTPFKQQEQYNRQMTRVDPLTGLPNGPAFQESIARYMARCDENDGGAALLKLDLDDFKHVNDTLGNANGDLLLQHVGGRLRHVVREEDLVSRAGDDQFYVVLEAIESDEAVEIVAERILESLSRPFQLDTVRISVSASIGTALYPRDAETLEQLQWAVDDALGRAKRAGRGMWHKYSPST